MKTKEMALRATELKIGNWIHWESKNGVTLPKDIQLDWNMLGNIWLENSFVKDYSFIPLTEEWQLKAGFNEDGQTLDLFGCYDLWIEKDGSELYLKSETMSRRIEYVHHLQNLHFALKGEELIINLN